ncbi:MAG TPA: 4a-hydroxytetrahydrobiopterin dehydratase [Terriglobia bacterium]|nr:4a-hydroxytetrahydrobiopterin dehydratase [Terriglobia bacterium]
MPQDAGKTGQTTADLASRRCAPCRGNVQPLPAAEIEALAAQLRDWAIMTGHHLQKRYRFADFRSALGFVNQVGEIAEAEGHHPDIALGWGRVDITLWTHAADGLTENDFILAARIDQL